jgi:hypothetical protein
MLCAENVQNPLAVLSVHRSRRCRVQKSGQRSVGLLIGVIAVRLPERRQVPAEVETRPRLSCGCETDAARATGNDDHLVREAAHPRFTGARIP